MVARRTTRPPAEPVPPLYNGDHLTQAEFHRRYEAMPEDFRAELIGGIVYVSSPPRRPHAVYHPTLSLVFSLYQVATPGTETLDSPTIVLDPESEPQPDLALRILSDWGGQTQTDEHDYILGPPELLAEIAHSSTAIDLHEKKDEYERAGVLEYVVLCVKEKELHWFGLKSRREIKPDRKGISRSRIFPGLWIDVPALMARDSRRLIEVIQQGTGSPEHARFVKRLEAARAKK